MTEDHAGGQEAGTAVGNGLRVVTVEGKGRGVLAGRRYAKDELIERCPVVVVPASQWPLVERSVLSAYSFVWPEGGEDAAVALGCASLFNHSYSPNAVCWQDPDDLTIEFVALRDIEEGEEITVNYTGDPDGRGPVGFHVVE